MVIFVLIAIIFTFYFYKNSSKMPVQKLHHQLYKMMQMIDNVLVKNKIDYTVTGGTLLGLVRDGGIIPHDDDVDLDIFEDQEDETIRILEEYFRNSGEKYKIIKASFGFKMVHKKSYSMLLDNGAQIDFFVRSRNGVYVNQEACQKWPEACSIPMDWLLPASRKQFGKIMVNAPSNPESILTQFYNDWSIPVVFNHGRF
jgi:phosphorylcholine metabolism protein LicD